MEDPVRPRGDQVLGDIPFGDRLVLGDRIIELQVAKIDVALLYIFAMLSLGVYGVILAGFASRNNYALLGGLRGTSTCSTTASPKR